MKRLLAYNVGPLLTAATVHRHSCDGNGLTEDVPFNLFLSVINPNTAIPTIIIFTGGKLNRQNGAISNE